jgi:hypothetical protein
MAENPTHLEIHTGQTKKLRIQASAPTDPTPTSGDVYIDNTTDREAIGIRNASGWLYVSLQV